MRGRAVGPTDGRLTFLLAPRLCGGSNVGFFALQGNRMVTVVFSLTKSGILALGGCYIRDNCDTASNAVA